MLKGDRVRHRHHADRELLVKPHWRRHHLEDDRHRHLEEAEVGSLQDDQYGRHHQSLGPPHQFHQAGGHDCWIQAVEGDHRHQQEVGLLGHQQEVGLLGHHPDDQEEAACSEPHEHSQAGCHFPALAWFHEAWMEALEGLAQRHQADDWPEDHQGLGGLHESPDHGCLEPPD